MLLVYFCLSFLQQLLKINVPYTFNFHINFLFKSVFPSKLRLDQRFWKYFVSTYWFSQTQSIINFVFTPFKKSSANIHNHFFFHKNVFLYEIDFQLQKFAKNLKPNLFDFFNRYYKIKIHLHLTFFTAFKIYQNTVGVSYNFKYPALV